MDYSLQPLRVPTGWFVAYNDLREVDPADVDPDDRYDYLKEDLLQVKQRDANRMLDVGWTPAGDLSEGAYTLVVYEGNFHGRCLYRRRTRDRIELVAGVERLLQDVSDGRL